MEIEEWAHNIEEKIAALEEKVSEHKKHLTDTNYLLGTALQRVTVLETGLKAKVGKRRDYDILAAELMKKVVSTRKYVDYRDIKNMFGFHGNEEAYRLMDRTVENYPETIVKRYVKNGKRGRHVLFLADM